MSDMRGEIRQDLHATLDARRDLGPDYEHALVESFAARLDEVIAAKVASEVAGQRKKSKKKQSGSAGTVVPVAICSLIFGIPITAIASEKAGLVGLMVVWIGIALVNVAVVLSTRD
ncbi:hypothetical protein [Nonomuraea soli]|uniref:Integral membrane protein n=1 Tax=Nonomuraea soli TaxID=1032476 RepID=A0A7W0CH64_9ACTN|nr:hypothetical protein [Nonomuraea soli]MBA2891064.1 hypothetical protein [Nonomuraea soli]